MGAKDKYPISRRDFLKLGLFLPFSFLLDRLPKSFESSPINEAWDPWREILPLVVSRERISAGEIFNLFTEDIVVSLKEKFPLKGDFKRDVVRIRLKNQQDFLQESIWYPEPSLLLLHSEFKTPFRNKERRCGLKSEVRLHWLDEKTHRVYTPLVISNDTILYQQTDLSPIVLSSDCPGNFCSGYCDYTCVYPLPPQGDRFCRSLPCVSDWWCLIRCGLECVLCADDCAARKWKKCLACAIANCGCGHCFSQRWTCDVCP